MPSLRALPSELNAPRIAGTSDGCKQRPHFYTMTILIIQLIKTVFHKRKVRIYLTLAPYVGELFKHLLL